MIRAAMAALSLAAGTAEILGNGQSTVAKSQTG